MQTLKIEAYSLFEFCQKVQEAVTNGYVFDFDSNDHFPTAFGSLLVAGMVIPRKDAQVSSEQEQTSIEIIPSDLTTGTTAVVSKGRPKTK